MQTLIYTCGFLYIYKDLFYTESTDVAGTLSIRLLCLLMHKKDRFVMNVSTESMISFCQI